jgi:hypothetical protein
VFIFSAKVETALMTETEVTVTAAYLCHLLFFSATIKDPYSYVINIQS